MLERKADYYLKKITSIPHGSYHEAWLADYIAYFCDEHDYRYVRDEMSNMVVYAPATKGYEKHEPVALQAHLDMVCESKPGKVFDFDNEPIPLKKAKGYYFADGTTLGADDAAGVAIILAILDECPPHPDLTCIFTVQEEVGLLGVNALDQSLINVKKLISLDDDQFGVTTISCAGSRYVRLKKDLHPEENRDPAYRLTVSGLLGGHSGDEIAHGRANAALLVARLLKHLLDEGFDVRLAKLYAGQKPNAIPNFGEAVFASISSDDHLQDSLEECFALIQGEYPDDSNIKMSFEEVEWNDVYPGDESDAIINAIYLNPNGVMTMSPEIKGHPLTSLNLGIAHTENHVATLHYCVRAENDNEKDFVCDRLSTLGYLFGFSVEEFANAGGWRYEKHSPLRKQVKSLYKQMFKKQMKEVAMHAGLEAGIFKAAHPDLDIVTLGAQLEHIHTYHERMNIQSFHDLYRFVKKLLGEL